MQGKLLKGCLESTVCYEKCESLITVNNIMHLCRRPRKFRGPRLQPIEPIGKSSTDLSQFWLSCVDPFVFFAHKLFDFQIF